MYLEQRVEELEKQVKELLEVFKPIKIGRDSIQAKPNNQLRKELIQESKDFVKDLTKYIKNYYKQDHSIYGKIKHEVYHWTYNKVEFSVNYKERKVSVKISGADGVKFTATAKCLPSDVFNVHLGKAIALGKVLGLDVSKFTDAVQPDEVVVGHVVASNRNKGVTWVVSSLSGNNNLTIKSHYVKCLVGWKVTYEITDDTNAKY